MPPTDAWPGFPRRRLVGWLAALLPGAAALAACTPLRERELRVGISEFPPYELMVLAQESGYFRDAGVRVRLVEFEDLSDAQRAFEQGKIDGLATTLVEVLVARAATARDLRIVRTICVSNGADVLIANQQVRQVVDLRNRAVAVEPGSLGHFMLARALELAGLQMSDVKHVPMALSAMPEALRTGKVSAAVMYPPHAVPLLASPGVHVIFSSRDIPGEVVDVYAFDAQVISARADDLKRFFTALDRAFARLETEPLESCRIMGWRPQLDAGAFCKALFDGITLVGPRDQARYLGPAMALRPTLVSVQRALVAAGLVDPRTDITDCLEPLQP